MALLPQTLVHEHTYKTARWPNMLLWALCCMPVLHTCLLLINDGSLQATWIQLLRPTGTLAAAGFLVYAAWLER